MEKQQYDPVKGAQVTSKHSSIQYPARKHVFHKNVTAQERGMRSYLSESSFLLQPSLVDMCAARQTTCRRPQGESQGVGIRTPQINHPGEGF